MNPPETPVKRGPGRPKKQSFQPIVLPEKSLLQGINEFGLGQVASDVPSIKIPEPIQGVIRIGDVYSMIDVAPIEWLPSILARVVKKCLKESLWSDVENLILSVRGFSK